MRRFISIFALALCVCLLAACGTEKVLDQMTGGQTAADSSDTDAGPQAQPEPTPVQVQTDSDTDAQPQTGSGTDFSAMTADECVQDALASPGILPRVTLDCPGAEAINQSIQEKFFSVAEDPMWELHYEYAKGAGRVLSIVMIQRANDWAEHTVYNLDLVTGQALTGAELLALLDVDTNELANLEQAVLGEEFTHQFGGAEVQTDREFYDQQYARTTSADNTELEKLWFSGDGQLCFAGRVYGLAGAEYYEYQLSTGWTF